MSNVKQFFILSDWSYDYDFEEFSSEEEAQNSLQATIEAARSGPEGLAWYDRLVWGKVLGAVGQDGQLIPAPCDPDPEVERLRAELVDFRARVGDVLAGLQNLEAHHRQGEKSLAHGGYNFERAEAYEYAADLLKEALSDQTNDGRACPVGGEE